jgi:hypothetical protein
MHNSNHYQQYNLNEGLEKGDLARLVSSKVTIDEYKSKIGKDEEIIVLAFKVQGKNPALDLVNFIEKSYDWVLDADASSGELDDGDYLIFVEMDREEEAAANIIQLLEDLVNLTDISMEEWELHNFKPNKQSSAEIDTLKSIIPLSISAYQSINRSYQEDIDKLKTAAGVRVETRAPKNDFTESLRIAAGIR